MLKAGALDRRVTIQRATTAEDAMGGEVSTWAALATVWAKVTPGGGRERIADAELRSAGTATFTIRWSSEVADVNPADRLLYAGREYDIQAVDELGRREGLSISATMRTD